MGAVVFEIENPQGVKYMLINGNTYYCYYIFKDGARIEKKYKDVSHDFIQALEYDDLLK